METTNSKQILYTKRVYKKLYDYYWNEYAELAKQRAERWEEIRESLLSEVIDEFSFKKWFRAVKWRYSNHPLCTLGSLKDPGGRFNIGKMNPDLIPQFSALYIAQDKEIAEKELLSYKKSLNISRYDLSLARSISMVSIRGVLDTVFDIRGYKKLTKAIKILKKFRFSNAFKEQVKKLKKEVLLEKSTIVQTRKTLHESILEIKWREKPMKFDVPSNSQIFGQMVRSSGITGVLYYSSNTRKECLAVFPSNFKNSSSFIELIDKPPNKKIPRRIDKSNFDICDTQIEI